MARLNLIMTWDIRPGREQEYSEFINERLAPGLVEIGLSPADVFYTAYGRVPQIMAILEVESAETLRRALRSRRWAELKAELLQYIENYKERVIRADSGNYFT
ncbi:MAG: NIPSNAP family protein [Anaerolineae bacterium]|nr:NIPSNAP family protein [Caldilineales bacterium]MCX7851634.1 NIPSNAP family protein [Caldilineales bacterium]MDW8270430.1 NIPSNAP family protein [Anaerolineae bacterium]